MPGSVSDEPIVYTIAQAAARLGIHRQTLRAAIERGDLHAVRVGRRWLVPVEAIDELLVRPSAVCGPEAGSNATA